MSLLGIRLRRNPEATTGSPRGDNDRRGDSGRSSDPDDRISDVSMIAHMLKRLNTSRSLVRVTFPGTARAYSSIVLGVNPTTGSFLLDELSPSEGHQLLDIDAQVKIQASLEGVELGFKSRVSEIETERGIASYQMPFPDTIVYRQRRAYHRAPIGRAEPATVCLEHDEGATVDAVLRDISLGGIGAETQFIETSDWIECGAVVRGLMDLPGQDQVSAKLEICHVHLDERRQLCTIGARYRELGRAGRRQIERYIAYVERDLLRRRPKRSLD